MATTKPSGAPKLPAVTFFDLGALLDDAPDGTLRLRDGVRARLGAGGRFGVLPTRRGGSVAVGSPRPLRPWRSTASSNPT